MARVFLGCDEVLDRPVAIKVLRSGFQDSEVSARFRREGRTAARLSHPNIVPVYDAGEDEFEGREVSYIVMEYVSGGDLKALIDTEGVLSNAELTRLGSQASLGLAHAHERGVIHRDIKPHNILIDSYGSPKLADFGIARALGATVATHTGSYLGTALYSSPEQLQGEKVSPKSDIYSLGCTLYQAAVGQAPFVGTPIVVANQHINQAPNKPTTLGARLSSEAETLILDCIQKDPDLRPSAEEVHERLQEESRRPHRNIRSTYAVPSSFEPTPAERTHTAPTEDVPAAPPPATEPANTERTRAAAPETPTAGPPGEPQREGDRSQQGRRSILFAAAVVLLVLLGIAAALTLGDQVTEFTQTSEEDQQKEPIEQAAPPAKSEEKASVQGQTTQANLTGSQKGSNAEAAAAQTLEDFYTSAAEGNYYRAADLLSSNYRQSTWSSESVFAGTFNTLDRIEFTSGPTAQVNGNTATVSFSTIAYHSWGSDPRTGTATLIQENGEWKIDRINV